MLFNNTQKMSDRLMQKIRCAAMSTMGRVNQMPFQSYDLHGYSLVNVNTGAQVAFAQTQRGVVVVYLGRVGDFDANGNTPRLGIQKQELPEKQAIQTILTHLATQQTYLTIS